MDDVGVERWCSRCRRAADVTELLPNASICRDCRNAETALWLYWHPRAPRLIRHAALARGGQR